MRPFSISKKFRQCFLHIGAPKTGTSSIQAACFENRAILADLGILYPSNLPNNHMFLASKFRENPTEMFFHKRAYRNTSSDIDSYHASEMAKLRREIGASSCETLVFSSELFVRTEPQKCFELCDYLATLAEKVTVVFYVRHPVDQLVSATQQGIQAGMETFRNPRDYRFTAAKVARKFSSAFGRENMCVREFHRKSLKDGDSVRDFLATIGVDQDAIDLPYNQENRGLSLEAVLLANSIGEQFPLTKDGHWHEKRARKFDLGDIPGSRFTLGKSVLEEIREKSAEGIQFFREEYGLVMHEPFIPDSDEVKAEWSQETLDALARHINNCHLQIQQWRAHGLYQAGRVLRLQGETSEAIGKFTAAINEWSGCFEALEALSILQAESGIHAVDIRRLSEKLACLHPGDPRFSSFLANL